MTDEITCESRAIRDDQETGCTRARGHEGVHLGPIEVLEGEHKGKQELVQWTDADAIGAQPVEELPTWYGILPLGDEVRVGYRDDRGDREGTLTGLLLRDDDDQPAAVRLQTPERVVLIPWDNVAIISWEREQ